MLRLNTGAIIYTLVKQLAWTGKVGGARVIFDLKVDNPAGIASAVIYKNGVPVTTNPAATPTYTVYTNVSGIYQTFQQDVSGLSVGDLVQIFALVNAAHEEPLYGTSAFIMILYHYLPSRQ